MMPELGLAMLLHRTRLSAVSLFLLLGLLASCVQERQTAEPPADVSRAAIPGIPAARYWGDVPPPDLSEMLALVSAQRRASGISQVNALVMSGGADYGAYGAAILNGLTEIGQRPKFTTITGVSTGALSAPFVFLGPKYDKVLKALYGEYPVDQIARRRNPFSIPSAGSLADTTPLANLIDAYLTDDFLAEIAKEHARGRRLFVMSTNFDAQRPVIWDLGAIASSQAPNAKTVFRNALMASSAIPVAFSPIYITVEADGVSYQEMHVDGGLIGQFTLNEGWQRALISASRTQDLGRLNAIYVIANNRIDGEPELVTPRVLTIANRTTSTMVKYQLRNDLLRAKVVADAWGANLYASWIDSGFPDPYVGPFDPEHLKALYDYGYQKALSGRAWSSSLPF